MKTTRYLHMIDSIYRVYQNKFFEYVNQYAKLFYDKKELINQLQEYADTHKNRINLNITRELAKIDYFLEILKYKLRSLKDRYYKKVKDIGDSTRGEKRKIIKNLIKYSYNTIDLDNAMLNNNNYDDYYAAALRAAEKIR